jgi:hypothetical protein
MPKEVLRSGASEPTTPAPTPAELPGNSPFTPQESAQIQEMDSRLKAMSLEPHLISAALEAEKKKIMKARKPVDPEKALFPAQAAAPDAPAATPASQPAAAKATKPAAPKPTAPAPAPAAPPPRAPTDEELRQAYEEDHGAEPAPQETRNAPEPGHVDDSEDEAASAVVIQNHWSKASGGAITGPVDRTDFKTPQVKIVQGSGPLSQKFNQGTLIFMDQVIFGPPDPQKPGPPINFIPVALQKYFRENLERDPVTKKVPIDPTTGEPMQPRNANTAQDVKDLGGTTEFTVSSEGKRLKPSWAPAARCVVILERPEGCTHEGFTIAINIGGKDRYFAPAIIFVNGGQYRSFFKPIIDATNFILCEGTGPSRKIILEKRVWKLQVVKELSGENMVFNPRVEMLPEASSPELRELASSLRGA